MRGALCTEKGRWEKREGERGRDGEREKYVCAERVKGMGRGNRIIKEVCWTGLTVRSEERPCRERV